MAIVLKNRLLGGFASMEEVSIGPIEQMEELRQRLTNANDFFRRKAGEVLNDEAALRLLADFHDDVVVELADFDQGRNGTA